MPCAIVWSIGPAFLQPVHFRRVSLCSSHILYFFCNLLLHTALVFSRRVTAMEDPMVWLQLLLLREPYRHYPQDNRKSNRTEQISPREVGRNCFRSVSCCMPHDKLYHPDVCGIVVECGALYIARCVPSRYAHVISLVDQKTCRRPGSVVRFPHSFVM